MITMCLHCQQKYDNSTPHATLTHCPTCNLSVTYDQIRNKPIDCKITNPTIGIKHDQEKPRYDLISPIALDELAKIYTFGAKKYGDHNMRNGIKWSRIFAAIMRHLWAMWNGEDIDKESGLPHVAHAAWGCFTLLEYIQTRKEYDDRYKPQGEK